MNDMRKLMETVEQFGEERTSDSSTVDVIGKTEFSIDGGRILNLEVREYKNNKFEEDGTYVYIREDGYDGFNLNFTLEEFNKLVNTINDLTIKDISPATFTTDDGREEPMRGRMSDDDDYGVGGLIDQGR